MERLVERMDQSRAVSIPWQLESQSSFTNTDIREAVVGSELVIDSGRMRRVIDKKEVRTRWKGFFSSSTSCQVSPSLVGDQSRVVQLSTAGAGTSLAARSGLV